MVPIIVGIGVAAVLAGAFVMYRSVQIITEGNVAIVERFGRYQRTVAPGLVVLLYPFDRVRVFIDTRQQLAVFPPQPMLTADNIVLNIDIAVYFSVVDPKRTAYAASNYLHEFENLTLTTMREFVADMTSEQTLRSRGDLSAAMREVLDAVTPLLWGIRVARVAIKRIDPPPAQPISAPRVVYHIGTVSAASNFGGGDVNAPVALGENNKAEIVQQVDFKASLELVQVLLREIRANASDASRVVLEDNAQIVQGEVLAAEAEKRQPDRHRIKAALSVITDLAGTGSSIIGVVTQIAKLFGLG